MVLAYSGTEVEMEHRGGVVEHVVGLLNSSDLHINELRDGHDAGKSQALPQDQNNDL